VQALVVLNDLQQQLRGEEDFKETISDKENPL
jgi:hypothetical protein